MTIKTNSKQGVIKNERDQLLSNATDQAKENIFSIKLTSKNGIAEHTREFIADNYPEQSEFVTQGLYEHLKNEYGLNNVDVSRQLNRLKKAGWIENREPTEAESEILGKGIKVWKGTEKLYKAYSNHSSVTDSIEEYKINKEAK